MSYLKIQPRWLIPMGGKFWLLAVTGLLGLSGCAHVIPTCNSKISPPAAELAGSAWELERWSLAPNAKGEVHAKVLPQGDGGRPIHMQFDRAGKRLSGLSGCNQFTAQITEDARGFTVENVASTRMLCSADRMELERAFLYQLNDYQRIVRDGDRLLIVGRDQNVLRFKQSGTLQ